VTWEGAAAAVVVVDVAVAGAAAAEEQEAAAAADGFISATKDLRIKSLVRNASSFLLLT
jgi:hypothetical protein